MVTYGYLAYHGDHIVRYLSVESLCCAPETNIMLYVSYTSIKKFLAVAGVAQWIECQPVNQRVIGLIPSQDTGLG